MVVLCGSTFSPRKGSKVQLLIWPDSLPARWCFTFGFPQYWPDYCHEAGLRLRRREMKKYRTVFSGFVMLCAIFAVARWAQVWPAAAAQRGGNRPAEQAGAARQTGFFGLAPGPAGPATELL